MRSLQTTRGELAARNVDHGEIARLRSESASKDLEIVDLHRRKAELKEDREMLNIALDSKQQELELVGCSPFPILLKLRENQELMDRPDQTQIRGPRDRGKHPPRLVKTSEHRRRSGRTQDPRTGSGEEVRHARAQHRVGRGRE